MAILIKDNVVKVKEEQREIDKLLELGYKLQDESSQDGVGSDDRKEELTRDELKEALTTLNVDFKGNASNDDLRALYEEVKGSQ
ncbi:MULTISPECIES: hypothetical protein [Vagococcus]|uniref:hypothetical protein n=1 Tax=Vagococcus TaxID=2737 RepID=UPI000E508BB8|nr:MULTISPECIES: hypothetical protein [Vagococcus]RHH70103.1 hypothetical protein DW196_04885 [Vagococcus sp. AM17-17]